MVLPLLAIGVVGSLVVGGVTASGYLADSIANFFSAQGKQTHYDTVDDVSTALVNAGRPDMAMRLNTDIAYANQTSYSTEGGNQGGLLGGILGGNTDPMQLALLGLAAYVIIKK